MSEVTITTCAVSSRLTMTLQPAERRTDRFGGKLSEAFKGTNSRKIGGHTNLSIYFGFLHLGPENIVVKN